MTEYEAYWHPVDLWVEKASQAVQSWLDLREQLTSEGLLP